MAIRNFWIEANIDGYKTSPSGGPRSKDDGMNIIVYQREDGRIKKAIEISCLAFNGELQSTVYIDGKKVGSYVSNR